MKTDGVDATISFEVSPMINAVQLLRQIEQSTVNVNRELGDFGLALNGDPRISIDSVTVHLSWPIAAATRRA
jgi:hypothetical protein